MGTERDRLQNRKHQDKQIHLILASPSAASSYHVSCLALVLLNRRQLSGPGLYKAAVDQGQPAGVLGQEGGQRMDRWAGLSE